MPNLMHAIGMHFEINETWSILKQTEHLRYWNSSSFLVERNIVSAEMLSTNNEMCFD